MFLDQRARISEDLRCTKQQDLYAFLTVDVVYNLVTKFMIIDWISLMFLRKRLESQERCV